MNPPPPQITCLNTDYYVLGTFYSTYYFNSGNHAKNSTKIVTMREVSKFFLLKGICRKFSFNPQRRIVFPPGQRIPGNRITFYQNDSHSVSLDINQLLFFINNITPFISFRILERLNQIERRDEKFNGIIQSGGMWPWKSSPNQRSVRPQTQTSLRSLAAPNARKQNGINPKELLLKITLLTSVLDLIPGTFTKNSWRYIPEKFFEKISDKFQHLHEMAVKIELNAPTLNSSYNLPQQQQQLKDLNKQFEFYRSIFNYIVLTKLILIDRTPEEILPFYAGAVIDIGEYLRALIKYLDGIKYTNRHEINNIFTNDDMSRDNKIRNIMNGLLELAPKLVPNNLRTEEPPQIIQSGPFAGVPLSGQRDLSDEGELASAYGGTKKKRSSSKSKRKTSTTTKKKTTKKSTSIKKKKKVTKS